MLMAHLAQASRHVREGERHIARQREIVCELERGGHDTSKAQALLIQFEELQALHVADCDRIARELGDGQGQAEA
jgi:hypothetical protein